MLTYCTFAFGPADATIDGMTDVGRIVAMTRLFALNTKISFGARQFAFLPAPAGLTDAFPYETSQQLKAHLHASMKLSIR